MDREERSRGEAATTVLRAIEILEAAAEGQVTLPQLVERLGISKTSAYRIASTLVAANLLETSGRTGYRIGRRLHELGAAYSGSNR